MAHRRTKKQWLELLEQQQQSGLSVAEFCRTRDLNAKNLYYQINANARRPLNEQPQLLFVPSWIAPVSTTKTNRASSCSEVAANYAYPLTRPLAGLPS